MGKRNAQVLAHAYKRIINEREKNNQTAIKGNYFNQKGIVFDVCF